MFLGTGPKFFSDEFGMKSMGYAPRVFSARLLSSRSSSRVSGSMTTFSSTVPNRFVVRSEEHTSELQSLMRISYAVFCLKKKNDKTPHALATQIIKHNTL